MLRIEQAETRIGFLEKTGQMSHIISFLIYQR
jgi:hypothetical protein